MGASTTPPSPASSQLTTLGRVWHGFRRLPLWVQVIAWVLLWPVLAALLIVSGPAPSTLRYATAVVVLVAGGIVWIATRGDDTPVAPVAELAADETGTAPHDREQSPADEVDPAPEDPAEQLAAIAEAICAEALTADTTQAGRTTVLRGVREAARETR